MNRLRGGGSRGMRSVQFSNYMVGVRKEGKSGVEQEGSLWCHERCQKQRTAGMKRSGCTTVLYGFEVHGLKTTWKVRG